MLEVKKNNIEKNDSVIIFLGGVKLTFLVEEDIKEVLKKFPASKKDEGPSRAEICRGEAVIPARFNLLDNDQIPCWADIWPAARGLADYLWDKPGLDALTRVIELGAGMGLPGIVCALKGARVTLSDTNPAALEMAGRNARRNNLHVDLLRDDWLNFKCKDKFDLILASDILYDPELNPLLGNIFVNNLRPGGTVLVAHPDCRDAWDFIDNCGEYGLAEENRIIYRVKLPGALLPRYRPEKVYPIVINSLRLLEVK